MMSPLTYIMGLPLAMALILAVVPSEKRQYFHWGARLATLGSLLLAIYVFSAFDPPITEMPGQLLAEGTEESALEDEYGYKFTQRVEWIPTLNINYYVGVDGIGIVMVLMAIPKSNMLTVDV